MISVLILDPDLGFQFWLGQALERAGHAAVRAQSVLEAERLLEGLELQIDVLIVDPTLDGVAEFVRRLREGQGRLRIIAVFGPETDLERGFQGADAVLRKPREVDRSEVAYTVDAIRRILSGTTTEKAAG